MALTAKQKAALSDDDFAVPGKRKLPIHDKAHAIAAWHMLMRTRDLTDAEVVAGRSRILARAKKFGVDTSGWKVGRKVSNESLTGLTERQQTIRTLMGVPVPQVTTEGIKDWFAKLIHGGSDSHATHVESRAFFSWCNHKYDTDLPHSHDDFTKLFPNEAAYNAKVMEFHRESDKK